jgi:NAD(P)H-dependent FMN reductase
VKRPYLQIIVGSVRDASMTGRLGRWSADYLKNAGEWTVELIDLADWSFPQFALAKAPAAGRYEDRLQQAWARTVDRGDAYLIAAPEYNHGYSGVLKTALDYLYSEWLYKPASCIAFGNAEGARMVESLQQVFVELGLIPVAPAVHIRSAHSKWLDGRFASTADDEKSLGQTSAQLLTWCNKLRVAGGDRTGSSDPRQVPPLSGRVLVMGLGEAAVASVVDPLRRGGVAADGLVVPDRLEDVPDARDYDLVSFGRGIAGPIAARLKQAFTARHPGILLLDTMLSIAVRQIEAALMQRAGRMPVLADSAARISAGQLRVSVELAAPGRIGLTCYQLKPTPTKRRIATVEAAAGRSELSCRIADMTVDSLVVDLDGSEFRHHPFASHAAA